MSTRRIWARVVYCLASAVPSRCTLPLVRTISSNRVSSYLVLSCVASYHIVQYYLVDRSSPRFFVFISHRDCTHMESVVTFRLSSKKCVYLPSARCSDVYYRLINFDPSSCSQSSLLGSSGGRRMLLTRITLWSKRPCLKTSVSIIFERSKCVYCLRRYVVSTHRQCIANVRTEITS